MVLEHTAFDPRAVLDGVLDTLSTEAARKSLELIGCVDDTMPAALLGDPGRLRQVLLNLAGNAVKFTDDGEVVIRLAIAPGAVTAPGAFLLRGSVRDTGIGIPLEHQARIFEAFAQVDASTTRRYGGTGLGLAITQRLVRLMGGRVDVDSEPAAGSRFGFTVRLDIGAPAPAPASIEPAGRRLLIVDPNGASRHHLQHLLDGWGCATTAVPAAADAAGFDCVVLAVLSGPPRRAQTVRPLVDAAARLAVPVVGLVMGPRLGPIRSGGLARRDLAAVVSKPVKAAALHAALAGVLVTPLPASGARPATATS